MLTRGKPLRRTGPLRAKPKARRVANPMKQGRMGESTRPKKRLVDLEHLARVRTMACIACVCLGVVQMTKTQAHHCRQGMMGKRPGDDRAAPVCVKHHLDQYPTGLHKIGERKFWKMIEIDPATFTERLYAETLSLRNGPAERRT